MEKVKPISNDTAESAVSKQSLEQAKDYKDFIEVLSQIIEKHGTEILQEIGRGE